MEEDYTHFMNKIAEIQKRGGDWILCHICGGTGWEPQFCCKSTHDACGCQGYPTDFFDKCDRCGRKGHMQIAINFNRPGSFDFEVMF